MEKAIISVSDKTNIVTLAKEVAPYYELLSTAGTYQLLKSEGIAVQKIEEYTGVPELLGGKVKTLHPKIFAGILCSKETEEIPAIRLVVANLYPLGKGEIDIGGQALLRAAAKNYEFVIVLCDPSDYEEAIWRMRKGKVDRAFRKQLAAKAFQMTSAYDSAIASSLDDRQFPAYLTFGFKKARELIYGENPTTQAALYVNGSVKEGTASTAALLQGKELSFNNILDADSAFELAKAFECPACVIVKHNNPCGVAMSGTPVLAYAEAFESDPLCAFGGVVAFNCLVDKDTAQEMSSRFYELVIAPEFDQEALEIFAAKQNLRLLRAGALNLSFRTTQMKEISGGVLLQSCEPFPIQKDKWIIVTQKKPSQEEINDLLFAAKVNRETKSNSSVIAKGESTLGVGAGQMSRIDSVKLALSKAKERARGAVLSSDGFFPFPDSIVAAAEAGIAAIIQPGESKKDAEVIAACDAFGISMICTGKRLFKH